MTKIKLTREQADQLVQIFTHFNEIPEFTIVSDSESGIGPSVRVLFSLFDNKIEDTTVDITDVSNW